MTTVLDPYRLELPPNPDFLITARLFAAAIARRYGSEALVDDVKLAITEAASLLLGIPSATAPIAIEVSQFGRSLRFVVAREGELPQRAVDSGTGKPLVGMDLVRSFFPSLTVTEFDDGMVTVAFEAPGVNP